MARQSITVSSRLPGIKTVGLFFRVQLAEAVASLAARCDTAQNALVISWRASLARASGEISYRCRSMMKVGCQSFSSTSFQRQHLAGWLGAADRADFFLSSFKPSFFSGVGQPGRVNHVSARFWCFR
jgi:hypothetical protein